MNGLKEVYFNEHQRSLPKNQNWRSLMTMTKEARLLSWMQKNKALIGQGSLSPVSINNVMYILLLIISVIEWSKVTKECLVLADLLLFLLRCQFVSSGVISLVDHFVLQLLTIFLVFHLSHFYSLVLTILTINSFEILLRMWKWMSIFIIIIFDIIVIIIIIR